MARVYRRGPFINGPVERLNWKHRSASSPEALIRAANDGGRTHDHYTGRVLLGTEGIVDWTKYFVLDDPNPQIVEHGGQLVLQHFARRALARLNDSASTAAQLISGLKHNDTMSGHITGYEARPNNNEGYAVWACLDLENMEDWLTETTRIEKAAARALGRSNFPIWSSPIVKVCDNITQDTADRVTGKLAGEFTGMDVTLSPATTFIVAK